MYIAKIKKNKEFTYIIRESVPNKDWTSGKDAPVPPHAMDHRDVFDLGPSPGAWIDYPGGNAWCFDPQMESIVSEKCRHFDPDRLEDLFWPWIRPDIKRAIDTFRNRSPGPGYPPLTRKEKQKIIRNTHPFDMRRAHFLKFGNMDQGPLSAMPAVIFRHLQQKSRDEIEYSFMTQEAGLSPREQKSYVYTVFDLQHFFKGFMAKKMPHALDQVKVETYFLKELCRCNRELFSLSFPLHDHLIRYVIMFFDNNYADTVLMEELEKDFIFRHRSFKPRPDPMIPTKKARNLFNISKQEMKTMDKKKLTRIFRKLARAHHPDKGGSHERFVEINNAYQTLVKKISPEQS